MEKRYLDLKQWSREHDVPMRSFTVPDGRVLEEATWNGGHFQQALADVRAITAAGQPLSITESPAPWITVGLIAGAKPASVGYLYPNSTGWDLPMTPLAYGTPAENYDVQFLVEEQDDRIILNMTADNPAARTPETKGPHTFHVENLEKVQVPELPAGKDVYIHAWGMFCVMCAVALTYTQSARSVWIASHETDYICAYSTVPGFAPGDTAKRTTDNPLPH